MNSDEVAFLKTFTPEHINHFSEPDDIYRFLGILESAITEIHELKQEVQSLRDEVNRLKGEQGKPNIKGKKNPPTNFSSEKERATLDKQPKNGRNSRNYKVEITRKETCRVNTDFLPPDAVFKGYSTVIVQDLKIEPDNIEFQIEHYYSPSTGIDTGVEFPNSAGIFFPISLKSISGNCNLTIRC